MKEQYKVGRQLGLAAAAVTSAAAFVATVPAVASAGTAPSAVVVDGVLTIRGTHADNAVVLDDGDPTFLTVDFEDGRAPRSFERSGVRAVAVYLGAGDDRFRTLRDGATPLPLTIAAGPGDDRVVGGAGADTIWGGFGRDTLLGGGGNDVVSGGSGADFVDGGVGTDTEALGSGDDTAAWVPGEGSDVVDGQSGRDTLAFDGANADEQMSLAPDGRHAVLLRTQGNIRMDLDSVERVQVNALGGADTVTVDGLDGTDVRQAVVDLGGNGGGDARTDAVIVNGSDRADHVAVTARSGAVVVAGLTAATTITGSEPTDRLDLRTLGGFDRVEVAPDVAALIGLTLDLGTGQV